MSWMNWFRKVQFKITEYYEDFTLILMKFKMLFYHELETPIRV